MESPLTAPGPSREASGIDAAKRALRLEAAERRRRAAAGDADAGARLRDRFLSSVPVPAAIAVSAFWPLPGEIDTRPLILALHDRGHDIGLPVVVGRGQPLVFRRWTPETMLVSGPFRVLTPPPEAPAVAPVLLIVPLLAFDRSGHRLGYGGGFYDRTLAALRAERAVTGVGVAYAAQETAAIPRDETDQPLDWVVTEQEAIRIAGR